MAVIAPMGLLVGIPFPSGLSVLSQNREGILPWAWGVNGALSVSGSVLTRILSTSAGFSVVLLVMAGLYLAAGALFRVNGVRRAPEEADTGALQAPGQVPRQMPGGQPTSRAPVRPAARPAVVSAASGREGRGLLFEAEKRRRA